jgi:hypothetical protein
MNNLAHYVRVYDDVFDADFCNGLINAYDNMPLDELKRSDYNWVQDYRSFSEVNICKNEKFSKCLNAYYTRVKEVYQHYKSVVNEDFFPNKYGLEDGRMKKYEANDHDQFGWHIDVGDKPSSERYLVMFCYLNDVEEGGYTEFKSDVDFKVKPKQGRMVVFPPMWMFPHKGMKPISGPKYILSTYLHYV